MKPPVGLFAAAVLAGSLAACSSGAGRAPTPTAGAEAAEPVLEVAAAFYPLELAVARVGGDRVAVTPLTQPGADPHDAELTPREVGQLSSVDLVVYLAGLQPAVDDAVGSVGGDRAMDVSEYAELTLTAADDGHDHTGESEEEHADHADETDATDPHFWLDPTRYASVAEAVADRLSEVDPEGAEEYSANATELVAELAMLDEELSTALESCTHRDLVTGHAAFGYLADRYDLRQVGITGLSPEAEPSAAQLRDLIEHVRETGVTTVYTETLVDPALTETIAREADVAMAVLDPIEGVTEASAGNDYFEIMRSNLRTLHAGQDCS